MLHYLRISGALETSKYYAVISLLSFVAPLQLKMVVDGENRLASFPGSSGGESRAWYVLFAHAREFMEQGQ